MAKRTLVLVAASVLGVGACAYTPIVRADAAQEQQQPGRTVTFGISASATVKAIDPATRTVTLTNADGEDVEVKCGKQVRNFDQLKVGNTVRAAAFARLVATMGNDAGAADAADATAVIRTPEGGEPGAMILRIKQRTAKIDSVDATNRTVTLSSLDDQKSKQVPVGKDLDLSKLKAGDEITLRVTRGVAIWVPQPGGARPAAGRIPGENDGEMRQATVTAIDAATGKVTIKGAEGEREIQMRPDSENFDQIKVGDKISAKVVPAMAISVSKSGVAAAPERSGMAVLKASGGRPGLLLAEIDQVDCKIGSVDAAQHTITITEGDGESRTVRTAPRVDLSDLKAGDEVKASLIQPVVIKVEHPQ